MKLRSGDKVKFLNDVGGGTIVSIIDAKKALVQTEDGFEIPVLISELVPDRGNYFTDQPEDEDEVKVEVEVKGKVEEAAKTVIPGKLPDKGKKKQIQTDEEIVIAAMTAEQNSELHVYLINNSTYFLQSFFSLRKGNKNFILDRGILEPGIKTLVYRFLPENVNTILRFDIQMILYKEELYVLHDPLNTSIFIKPSEIYLGKLLKANNYFDKKVSLFPVLNFKENRFSESIKPGDVEKLFGGNAAQAESKKERQDKRTGDEIQEVDLHIEEILEDYSKLGPGEILEAQMSRFKTALETAIIHKSRRIVFIHGIGNGQLKYKIRKTIDDEYPDLKYQDASFREYGYGATMVII